MESQLYDLKKDAADGVAGAGEELEKQEMRWKDLMRSGVDLALAYKKPLEILKIHDFY